MRAEEVRSVLERIIASYPGTRGGKIRVGRKWLAITTEVNGRRRDLVKVSKQPDDQGVIFVANPDGVYDQVVLERITRADLGTLVSDAILAYLYKEVW